MYLLSDGVALHRTQNKVSSDGVTQKLLSQKVHVYLAFRAMASLRKYICTFQVTLAPAFLVEKFCVLWFQNNIEIEPRRL